MYFNTHKIRIFANIYETKGSNRAARVRTEEEPLFLKYICLSQYVDIKISYCLRWLLVFSEQVSLCLGHRFGFIKYQPRYLGASLPVL